MNKEIDILTRLLKDEIQSKFGKCVSYASDCQFLSEQIQNSTQRQISVSTLKRLFGIIKSNFDPSKYTLDTLAIYLQYSDWHDFIDNFEKEKSLFAKLGTWENLKERTNVITSTSLSSLKNKIGSRFEIFPIRKFAEEKLDAFLRSSSVATAFVSLDSYDKSTIVTQLTEKFFTGLNAKYPDDIVCLVDGSIFYNLITHHPKVTRLNNLVEFNPKKGFDAPFRDNPELVRGRFVLVIEGIDDIYSDPEKRDRFIVNLLNILSAYENVGYFKLLITCSPNIWRRLSDRIHNNQMFKSLWFDAIFEGEDDDFINTPQLTRKEIKAILEKNDFPQNLDYLCFNHPDILEIIKNPSLLYLFLTSYNKFGTIRDIDLLSEYIKNTVLNPPYQNEKFVIVKLFFTLCGYGKNGNEIRKEELHLSAIMTPAYNDLIRGGILYEYSIYDSYLTLNTFVKFPHNVLFAYYLANILIKENELNSDFLKNIIEDYKDLPKLQYKILSYVIKILFRENQVELLKNIFSIIDKDMIPEDIPTYDIPSNVLISALVVEMRRNHEIREIVIPWYAQSEVGRKLFFERFFDIDCVMLHSGNDLDHYLKYDTSNEAKQYVCFMKFMQNFLAGNEEKCLTEYKNSLNLMLHAVNDSLNTSFHIMPQIIYQSVFEHKLDRNIIKEVYRISDRLLKSRVQDGAAPPYFEYTVIYSLNYGKMDTEIIDFANYIFEKYDVDKFKSSCLTQLFLSIYASALLHTGETIKAMEIYNQLELKNVYFPVNMKYYVKIRLLLIIVEFLIYQGKINQAMLKLERIKYISQMLKFDYFYNNALELEKNIWANA